MNPTVQLIEEMTDRALGRTDSRMLLSTATERAFIETQLDDMVRNAAVAEMPTPPGRNRFMKRLILKLGRFTFIRQQASNQALVGAMHALIRELDSIQLQLDHERRRSIAAIAAFEQRLVERSQHQRDQHNTAIERIDEVRSSVQGLQETVSRMDSYSDLIEQNRQQTAGLDSVVDEQHRRLADLSADLQLETTRRNVLERELALVKRREADPTALPNPEGDGITGELPQFDLLELYERFEASFRPPGDDLTARFKHYLTDLQHLSGGRLPVLDIGTGRGDFLSVLTSAGIPCRGLDLNPEAVATAQKAGLDVVLANAYEYLQSLPDEALGAVTAFHVVEHIPPAQLLELLDQIVRVLAPGGVLILETPNPTNLVVGASSFYHDPTHERPVTPDYLAFVVQDRGLLNVETRFLHPLPEYEEVAPVEEVLGGRSLQLLLDDVRWALKGPQDYAIIAQRPSGK